MIETVGWSECSVKEPYWIKSNLLKFWTCTCLGCVARKEGRRVSVHIVQSYTNSLGWKSTVLLQSVRKASSTDGSPTASGPNHIGDLFLWLAELRKTTRRASMSTGYSERICVKEAAFAWSFSIESTSNACTLSECRRMLVTTVLEGSYLVDPASSHMLVSKIKPCMSKCK